MKLHSKIGIICIIAFLAITFYGYFTTRKTEMNYEFNGVVEHIEYTEKGFPVITIKNVTYDFGNPHFLEYTRKIERGDSVMKKAGSSEIKIMRFH